MKTFPLLFCFVLFFAFVVPAQTDKTLSCPKIDITTSDEYAKPGKIFTFTAKVENYDITGLSFKWVISSGEILEGQETLSIKVKVNEKGETPTAVVEITGLPEGCPTSAVETPPIPAQTNQTSDCPTLDVSGGGIAEIGQPVSFTANIIDPENRQFEYVWTVSGGGKIVSGQGTSTITVELTAEQNITVTVEVKGFPEGCLNTDSDTLGCDLKPPKPNLFDEYGSSPNGEFKARVHNFYVELGNNPGAQGYIINYGTAREIARREKQIRDTIVFLDLEPNRLTLVRGGANPRGKGVWTKVWIVPPGADNPTPDM